MTRIRLRTFETLRRAGSGGMGTVWEGRHVASDTPVAIKFLDPQRAEDYVAARRFETEARAVARLEHPRIVKIYDVGMLPDTASLPGLAPRNPYIVMEWVPKSLADFPRPLAWDAARSAMLEVLDALAHVHARNVVHRDVKPSNVLGRFGRLRLADFGISEISAEKDETSMHSLSGTPYFMAPEQFTSSAGVIGPWTDLYAVGCVTYLLATGTHPFAGETPLKVASRHIYDPFPTDDLTDELGAWLRRMTAKNPRERYAFAANAARDLAVIADAFPHPSRAPTERMISPGAAATKTLGMTTIALEPVDLPSTRRLWQDAAHTPSRPSRIPDWRPAEGLPDHVEHVDGASLALSMMRYPPLVGREEERDAMWEQLRDGLLAGQTRATYLVGEQGVGKTRLAEWFAQRSTELGLARFLGPIAAGPEDPFLRIVRAELGLDAESDAGFVKERVDEWLGGGEELDGREKVERNAVFRWLTGRLDTQGPRDRLDAIRAALARLATPRPAILILDDCDGAHDVLEVVQHTVRAGAGASIQFVLTSSVPLPDPRSAATVVELEPLGDAHMHRIVENLGPFSGELVPEILKFARGNPGRARTILHSLVERGALRNGASGYELLSREEFHDLSDDELWEERLDLLVRDVGHAARSALEVAAALGDEVDDYEWEAACEATNTKIPSTLRTELEVREFAIRLSSGWRFASPALVRRLRAGARQRNTWKSAIAGCRQAIPSASLDRRAFWAAEAGAHQTASELYLEAAQVAELRSEFARAAVHVGDAARSIAELPESEAARLRTKVGILRAGLWSAERADEAADVAKRAVRDARANGWDELLGLALERRAKLKRRAMQLDRAGELYLQAEHAYAAIGDDRGSARALQGLGMVSVAQGDLRAAESFYNRALNAFLPLRDLAGAAWCANGLGDVYRKREEWALAKSWYERALGWFETTGNAYGAMWCVHDLACTRRAMGDLDGAEQGLVDSIRYARNLGQRVVAPRLNLGVVRVQRGDAPGARPIFEEVLRESRLRGQEGEEGLARICLLPCDAEEGRWDDVRSNLREGRRQIGSLIDADLAAMADVAMAYAKKAGERELAAELGDFVLQQRGG